MIISRTPFRISFFGGGTDYPEHFLQHGGAVLGTAIDKYAYLSATPLYSRLFDYKIRLAYREVECVNALDDIRHAPFRECLRQAGIQENIELDYTAELPSSTGLGTSSSFVVGLLHALHAFRGEMIHPLELAYRAIRMERQTLGEAVGCQDQTFAALGGFNLIEFRTESDIQVQRVQLPAARQQEFEAHLLLFFTGLRRRASAVASRQVQKVGQNLTLLKQMRELVDLGYSALVNGQMTRFGELLHTAWSLKHQLDQGVSNPLINEIYETGRAAGALGGKLLGAGGGGFVAFFVPPERRAAVCEALAHLETLPIRINAPGTQIIHASHVHATSTTDLARVA